MNRKTLYLVIVGLAMIGGGLAAAPATADVCSQESEIGTRPYAEVDCFHGYVYFSVGNDGTAAA